MTVPHCSVLVPTYRQQEAYLRAALQSARLQTIPVEVCVCDDGSDPPQEHIIEEMALEDGAGCIKYAWQPNGGVAAALNKCLEMATAEWIAWLPSDDLYTANHLQTMIEALDAQGKKGPLGPGETWEKREEDAGLGLVAYSSYEESVPIPQARWPAAQFPSRESLFEALQRGCFINAATLVWHRSVFDKVGAWDTSYPFCQDYEHILRCAERYQFLAVHHYGVRRRLHPKQLTETLKDQQLAKTKQAEHDCLREKYGSTVRIHHGVSGGVWVPEEPKA